MNKSMNAYCEFTVIKHQSIMDFSFKEPLVKNRTQKKPDVGGRFVCHECNIVYASNIALKLHKQSKHDMLRYNCDHCEYKATRQNLLIAHKQSFHEGMRYSCDQCDQVPLLGILI